MLPIRIKPKNYELVSSWLRRLANQNGTDLNTLSNLIFSNSKLLVNDIDKYLTTDEILRISSFTGVKEPIIYQLTIHSILSQISILSLSPNSKWNWCIPSGGVYKHKTNGLQFCPLCLKEGNDIFYIFCRLSWNISCMKHKCLLHTNCPNCDYKYSPHLIKFQDIINRCTNCNFDLSTIDEEPVNDNITDFQVFLNSSILKTNIVQNQYLFLDKNVKELFYSIKVFTSFIHRNKKNTSLAKKITKYMCFNQNLQLLNSFDSMSCFSRLEILTDVVTIIQLNVKKLIYIFSHSKITYRQFLGNNDTVPLSETSKKISSVLKNKTIKNNSIRSKKTIKPRSIKEVDTLMNEVELFL